MNRPRRLGLVALHLSVLALAGWIGTGSALWIIAAAPLAVGAVLLFGPHGRMAAIAGAAVLAGIVGALATERHLESLAQTWPERSRAREADVLAELESALDALLQAGEGATVELAARWADGSIREGPALPSDVRPPSIHALAVFGASGELVSWEGEHQGPVPDPVRFGESRYIYDDGALFGYLYVTQRLPDDGTAVAAALLRSDLPTGLDPLEGDFESLFQSRTGALIEVARADRAEAGSVWDLEWEGETLFSVILTPSSEADARGRVELTWSRVVIALLLLGWFFAVLSAPSDTVAIAAGAGALPVLFLLLPLGRLTGWGEIFSPAGLLLPGPPGLTLGDLLALGAAGALLLGLLSGHRLPRLPLIPVVALAIPLAWGALMLLELGSSRDLLAEGQLGWLVFQATALALVLLPMGTAVLLGGRRGSDSVRVTTLIGSLAIGVVLSLGWLAQLGRTSDLPQWIPLLWAVPLLGFAWSAPSRQRWAQGLARWAGAAFLAVTMVLPWAWGLRVESQMAAAEERIDRLGTRSDPFLEFLLLRAGEQASALAAAGRDPVEVLYGAWTESGLAREGLPLWITYWSVGEAPQDELRVGVTETRPPVPDGMLEEARTEGRVVVRRFDLADAHYVGVAPLARGALFSLIVPPRRMLEGSSPLGPLFSPARSQPDPLVLIPLHPGEVPGETEGVRWLPTPEGWRGETFIAYPDEVYHAHYLLGFPGWLLLLARGGLVLLLNLAAAGLLWSLGRWMAQGHVGQLHSPLAAPVSFRGRVTLALFAFFLIPSVFFGTLAYRTLAGAAIRTAASLAERAVEDARTHYFEVDGALDLLASRVESDFLLYENGELVGGSLPELVQLGLYEGWVPPMIHEVMLTGEAATTTATSSLGGWEYVVAYRRMPGGRVLAAPAPLQAGATALRQRDVADLIAFSLALGGALSVLLALAVGRALARPIQTLRLASERVGAGNMAVQVPEERTDEFGAVFDAFNRMVDRLGKTRRALLRSSRQTRAIVEEVAIGVVALDPEAKVTLANPRVEQLLGVRLERDRPLPRGTGVNDPRAALVDWVEGYFRDGLREAGKELSFGDRRIRVRARRISRRGPPGGGVLTLEDVTDELRTERILAWGEMAQQVAHEVKNPLTPIKLGVQHIRRAWVDGQPDYEEILNRNIGAILDEIERLASIAGSFSRYAAPSPAGVEPLEGVSLSDVIEEVLDLYAAGGGPVTFRLLEVGQVVRGQARSAELKEVLVNLLENARAALPRGGLVRIEVEEVEGEIQLRVVDDGTGIPPQHLPRIFEPHFSTRSSGAGLGLAIVHRLVESWGGRVHAESGPEKGTVIRIRMVPWDEESAASKHPPSAVAEG